MGRAQFLIGLSTSKEVQGSRLIWTWWSSYAVVGVAYSTHLPCLSSGNVVDLGHPDTDYPPALMAGGNGVLLNYTHGDCCDVGCEHRYQTDLVLVCDRNEPVVSAF